MATNYERGRRWEYMAVFDLRKAGYTAVRTAGSHGPFDVIAMNADGIRLIQVKGPGALNPSDAADLLALAVPECASLEVWERVYGKWDRRLLAND